MTDKNGKRMAVGGMILGGIAIAIILLGIGIVIGAKVGFIGHQ